MSVLDGRYQMIDRITWRQGEMAGRARAAIQHEWPTNAASAFVLAAKT
jgi:hypothetical protein